MGIALFTISGLMAPFLSLANRCVGPRPQGPAAQAVSVRCHDMSTTKKATTCARVAKVEGPFHVQGMPVRPLRVVRVAEPGGRAGSAGRMVISGRMADVCAELDRLASRETGLQQS
jgi:hypothetical protein